MMQSLAGVRIFVSPLALEETKERLFPESRHRSARIHKKLLKRFGGEFRRHPCMWRLPSGDIVAHPDVYARLRAMLSEDERLAGAPSSASNCRPFQGVP